jgi:DNA-binding GntR family transcriptional regulator
MITEIIPSTTSIYGEIMVKIQTGDFAPGSRLVEQDLAQVLGVSRVSVRAALGRLVAQGVLISGDNGRGVFVRNYSWQQVHQLFEYRLILETEAAALATSNATDTDLTRLSMLCESMGPQIDCFASDPWERLDYQFHQSIALASHNDRLIHALDSLLTEYYFVFYVPALFLMEDEDVAQARDCDKIVREHRAIVSAIADHDSQGAHQASRDHVQGVADFASRYIIAKKLRANTLEVKP